MTEEVYLKNAWRSIENNIQRIMSMKCAMRPLRFSRAPCLGEPPETILTRNECGRPLDFPKLHSTNGRFDDPFGEYTYHVRLDDPGEGAAVHVSATVAHSSGLEYSCETHIAVKMGEEPNPAREPEEPLDRILRYEELEAND